MKVVLADKNKNLLIKEVPTPKIGEEEVLIKVAYAAVNRADLMQREGTYPPPPGCPEWLGLEVSGVIMEAGAKAAEDGAVPGAKVCALLGGGGYAEYVAVRYDMTMPVPTGCTLAEAAAMPEAFATAYLNLFIEGGLKRGDVFLMHAGASGLASVVIPMAKAFGAYVVTTIIDGDKRAIVAKTGADRIVNTKTEDIVKVLTELDEAGTPVSLAIDCLGGEVAGKCLPHLAYMAKWIMIATLAGDLTSVDMRKLYVRNVRFVGSTLRSKPEDTKAEILRLLVRNVWEKVSSGEIRPAIFRILPIERAEEAHALLQEGKSAGKVVLEVAGDSVALDL